MQAEHIRVEIPGVAPIPVGHTVEVWNLENGEDGLLASAIRGCMVRHVDTGIVYAPLWAYGAPGAMLQVDTATMQIHPEIRIVSKYSARVVHCRILAWFSKYQDQGTTLILTPHRQRRLPSTGLTHGG